MNELEQKIEAIVRQVMDRLAGERNANAPAMKPETTKSLATIETEQLATKVVTIRELAALQAATRRIVIKKGTVITPAARDWLQERKIDVTWSVQKDSQQQNNPATKSERHLLIGNVIEQANIAGLLNKLRKQDISIQQIANTGYATVVSEMAYGVSRSGFRGVLFTNQLWPATVLANKRSGVMAVHAREQRELEQIKKHTAVNLLIINPRGLSEFAMLKMIQQLFKS